MAFYDNKHWLLSHIRNSFISSDDTGMCEMVMLGEDIPRKLDPQSKFDCYPGIDESDEEDDEMDAIGHSFDIQSDMEFGAHRQRSNTAQRLEKMDQDRKRAARIKHIKWEWSPAVLTDEERGALFERKDFKQINLKDPKETKSHSLLSEQLEKSPHLPHNPFLEFAKYDGTEYILNSAAAACVALLVLRHVDSGGAGSSLAACSHAAAVVGCILLLSAMDDMISVLVLAQYLSHCTVPPLLMKRETMATKPPVPLRLGSDSAQVGVMTKKYGIFLTMLPTEKRNYPMPVTVISSAKVQDLIGLILLKCTLEHAEFVLKESVDHYGLHIVEDDGEVDWDFPCLEPRETVGKFGFGFLALVERTKKRDRQQSVNNQSYPVFEDKPDETPSAESERINRSKDQDMEKRMRNHLDMIDAPIYQSYRVYIINKMRTKTEINLGISGEKIEIDPVVQQKVSAKFWNRQKPVSYPMDSVAACDLIDKSSSRATFRLVCHQAATGDQAVSLQGQGQGAPLSNFKHHDFETELGRAEEIVRKICLILDLRSSPIRKEYLALRERKSHRRRSFHLGPR
uniref:Stress-activated map kinase-interacting protein 1 n=1 Tax=Timema genevievae TaxID=629358 RepID=A0A7R9JQH6_TIMGE|nr:unnamed protein product [Timema genevievae]